MASTTGTPEFRLEDEPIDDATHVVAVHGDVDLFTAPELKERILEVIERGRTRIVVDLTGATSIDSTTLGVLIGAVKRLRLRDGDLAVAARDPMIVRTFEITGLDEVFGVLSSREEAVERLAGPG
jgi:anti-sigma B factor antagonist